MEEIKVYMNKTIITALLLILTLGAKAEQKTDCQISVEVSETVELMGILSRTAGFQEYCHDLAGEYTKDTEAWFAPHKTHPTIAYYQDLRANCGKCTFSKFETYFSASETSVLLSVCNFAIDKPFKQYLL